MSRILAAAAAALALAGGAPVSAVAAPASLTTIERQVMCVTCKIPLQAAESPQADRERAFIGSLIGRGYDEAAIKRALVAQYGASVLGLPADHGFDAAAYLVPLAAVIALAATFLVLLPRWRRRAGRGGGDAAAPVLSSEDAARLESDLARFD